MTTETIHLDTVKVLIGETISAVTAVTDKRQDAHEVRTADQMHSMSLSIDKMAATVGTAITEVTDGLRETNKQLASNNSQLIKWEQRSFNQTEEIRRLDKKQETQGRELRGMHDEQIKDNLTRAVTWKVGAIVLAGVLGGAFTFAWWMIKTITSTVIRASGAPIS